ncbi:MAG: exodeoxyribonuclease VII large subunit [Chitinivibrionales bacterium]|nr:exodeoxyribonuclease VII large subunit [Chitinivibrionales bacterium]
MNDDEIGTFLPPTECSEPYSVTQINQGVAAIIEAGNTLVWVEGEISNFKRSGSGHCYLKLKDAESQVPAVIWRSTIDKFQFEPQDGMAVLVIASVRVYTRGGYYQLEIHRMQPAGQGALALQFEQLKKRLEAEGLFDARHKRPLPESVCRLGVITAKTGAAVRDIIRIVSRRSPQTDILICDVPVQGDKAPAAIAAGLAAMNAHGKVDCIIVGRGGGSVEDLWAFNTEEVARAIYHSSIPVISAVGHEIDYTIADFVADLRAPTPSAAAELAVGDNAEQGRLFQTLARRFFRDALRAVADCRARYDAIKNRIGFKMPLRRIAEARQQLDDLGMRAQTRIRGQIEQATLHLQSAAGKLNSLSPLATLARGYAVVTDAAGKTVNSYDQVAISDALTVRLKKGRLKTIVTETNPV